MAQPETSLKDSKYKKIMDGLDVWTAYYRANPVRFLIDYFGMEWIRPFQQVMITFMFRFTYFMTIASRGMGKSMIVAAFLCAYCTLYPGVQVCIAAGQRGQSINVLNKIVEEFMPKSPNLRNEIAKVNTSPAEGFIHWKNGSIIKVVTASDSARSARANIIIMDEFRMIDKGVLDKVLRKFKAGQRRPGFYDRPEYSDKVKENKKKYPKEPNKEIYLSSAYYKYHWSWAKFKAFFNSMTFKGESYMVVGFPYQLPVSEGYYPEEQIREEMQEDDFDSIAWSMEMDSLFFGSSEKAFYSFESIDRIRKIQRAIYPKPYYAFLNDSKYKFEPKKNGEIRLLAMDIATQGGSKNDATCFVVMQLIPATNNQYIRNGAIVRCSSTDGISKVCFLAQTSGVSNVAAVQLRVSATNGCCFMPGEFDDRSYDGKINLGISTNKWKQVYTKDLYVDTIHFTQNNSSITHLLKMFWDIMLKY